MNAKLRDSGFRDPLHQVSDLDENLRCPIVKRIDITKDYKGTFYAQGNWA